MNTKKPTKTVTVRKKDWYTIRSRKGGLYLLIAMLGQCTDDPLCGYRYETRQEAEEGLGILVRMKWVNPKRWEIARITVTERKTMSIFPVDMKKTRTSKSSIAVKPKTRCKR